MGVRRNLKHPERIRFHISAQPHEFEDGVLPADFLVIARQSHRTIRSGLYLKSSLTGDDVRLSGAQIFVASAVCIHRAQRVLHRILKPAAEFLRALLLKKRFEQDHRRVFEFEQRCVFQMIGFNVGEELG